MLGEVLLPQQCQRHAAPLQLPLDRGPVTGRALICTVRRNREQSPLELCIVDPLWDRPPDPSRLSPSHVLGCLRLAGSRRLADLAVAHSKRMLQTKHFAYLAHRQSLRRHRWPPFAVQGARDQVIRLSMGGSISRSSHAVRNQPDSCPAWLEVRVRNPPSFAVANAIVPDYALGNHVAALGLAFARGTL